MEVNLDTREIPAGQSPKRRFPPRVRLVPGLGLALAPIVAAVLIVGLVWASSGPTATSTGSSRSSAFFVSPPASGGALTASPSIVPSADAPTTSSVPANLPDPNAWAADPRLESCGGLDHEGARVLTIVPIDQARDYETRLPAIGFDADLALPDPALIVVYDGAGPSDGILRVPEATGPKLHLPAPGTFDVCVGTAKTYRRLVNLPIDWNVLLGLRTPNPPRIVTSFANVGEPYAMYGSNLVWDAGRDLLWFAVVTCGEESSVAWVDPRTGVMGTYAIPSNTFGNCDPPQVGLDGSGNVWVMENSWLVRYDPGTKRVGKVRIAPATATSSRTEIGLSFPTAMAFDGDIAIVARFNTPYLTRVTPDMKVATIPVPPDIAGARGLAVWGDDLYALTDLGVAVVPLSTLPAASPGPTATPPVAASHPGANPLSIAKDGGAVLWKDLTTCVLLGDDGSELHDATVIPTPPPFIARAIRSTVDWHGRAWYVVGDWKTAILEVNN